MSMKLARDAFIQALGPNSGVSLLRGVAQSVDGGKQLAVTFTVMNPDGTTTDITQTINAQDSHIEAASSLASGYVTQLQQAGKLSVAATPSTDTMSVTPTPA